MPATPSGTDDSTVDVTLDVTVDTVLRGLVTLVQPVRGLRSSLDPILLATFLRPPFGRFVDIGCGAGALGFSLAALDEGATGVMVEIQPRLAALAEAGRGRNPFGTRLQIVRADVRQSVGPSPLRAGSFDLVVSNPPFRALAGGVVSPDPERAQANHEVTLALDEWLDVAAALRAPGGRIAVVYPAERLPDLERGLRARGLTPLRRRLCAPSASRPPMRVLLEAGVAPTRSDASGAAPWAPVVEPLLVLHESGGGFTSEVRRLLGDGNPPARDPQLARS